MLCVITIALKLLSFVSWPMFEYVPRELKKKVHSAIMSYSYVFLHKMRYNGLCKKTENTGAKIPSNV